MMRVLFAHGFEGSPDGGKPTHMIEELGWDVVAPVMSANGWTIEQETNVLLEEIDAGDFDLVAGSSMGGLAAANASALRPNASFGLLLIAPAFGLAEMWHNRLSTSEMEQWQKMDAYEYRGFELEMTLDWDFMQTAEQMSWPRLNHPTVILHGIPDDVVPIENSRRVTQEQANVVELIELDDGHRMQQSKSHFERAAALLGHN
ncbi:MAG: YqiA/YcfP family alpha/beta fold hydrolase [Candidatus Thalassarchaeaceae archaeon]|nr:YqiA/YcfP family alpha/beta fold hydrolase [Candidatus Thalassarchaeaceae archaeon]